MYVHLTHLIKDDGVKIHLLHEQIKENMSAAQRMGLAGLYVGKEPNMLLPSDRRDKGDESKKAPLITNSRGNVDLTTFRKPRKTPVEIAKNIGTTVVEAVQSGAASAAAVVDLKPNATIETVDELAVEPIQNGLINTDAQETFTGVNGRIQPVGTFMRTSDGKSVFAH